MTSSCCWWVVLEMVSESLVDVSVVKPSAHKDAKKAYDANVSVAFLNFGHRALGMHVIQLASWGGGGGAGGRRAGGGDEARGESR